MQIKPYSDIYLDESAKLLVHIYSKENKKWDLEKAKEYIQRNTVRFSDYCLVALDDHGTCIGGIFCRIDPDYDRYLLYIDLLQVIEEYRNQGVGKNLLRRVIAKAKEKNINSIQLLTDGTEEFPQNWYQQMGFKKTGWIEYEAMVDDIRNIL